MMALVLGGLSFVLYNNLSKEDDKPVAQKQELTPKEKAEPSLSKVDSLLQTKDLKFSTVDSLCDLYQSQLDTTETPANRAAFQRLNDYRKVIGFIREGKVDSITRVVESNYMYELYDIHQKVLKLIVENSDKNIFEEQYKYLKGFDDIRKLYLMHNTLVKRKASGFKEPSSRGANEAGGEANERSVEAAIKTKRDRQKPQFQCTQGCVRGGSPLRFKTQAELDTHNKLTHER